MCLPNMRLTGKGLPALAIQDSKVACPSAMHCLRKLRTCEAEASSVHGRDMRSKRQHVGDKHAACGLSWRHCFPCADARL
eukprot:8301515-Pyramimonas_sp.AAC.1